MVIDHVVVSFPLALMWYWIFHQPRSVSPGGMVWPVAPKRGVRHGGR